MREPQMVSIVGVAAALLVACCSSRPYVASGSDEGQVSSPGLEIPDAGWTAYWNERYGIGVRYPPGYRIVIKAEGLSEHQLVRIEIRGEAEVGSPMEAYLPPRFAIEVFDQEDGSSLESWLRSNGGEPEGSRYSWTAVEVGGAVGVRVDDSAQLAPNVFYYAAVAPYVYRFIPLGEDAAQILETVSFQKPPAPADQ